MPVKYVATLGAVAGIPQVVNMVVITCDKPTALQLTAVQKATLQITVTPTITPTYGGD